MDNTTEPKSALLEEANKGSDQVPTPDYSEDETKYLGMLQNRLEQARVIRESPHDEFDGMTYSQYWEANEKGANTYIEPKKNADDNTYQSGTIRVKLFTFLAELLGLDLTADISAFDENEIEIDSLGDGMEDIIEKTEELDGDEEKKMLRQFELLKQGDVFVEEEWCEEWVKDKLLDKDKPFDGKISGVSWTTKMKRLFARPRRNVISGINVYLGNMRMYELSKQPYLFTVDYQPYYNTEQLYGQWERWEYVQQDLKPLSATTTGPSIQSGMRYNNWRLNTTQKGMCEIIRYQDKPNKEFALVINGVLMTPVGLPFPWGYNDYNLAQQHLKPIHANFSYGSSLVRELRNNVGLADELKRALLTKTWQSVLPPLLNTSGRVISRRVLMPAAITQAVGFTKNDLVPIVDKVVEGVTAGEFNFMNSLVQDIDRQSVTPIASGQSPNGDQTATEVMQVSMQAKKMLGVIILSSSLLEWKLTWLRLYNLLQKWFDPVDEELDEARKVLKNKYRTISVERPIPGQGIGRKVISVTDTTPTPEEVYSLEESLSKQRGKPYRFTFINPKELSVAKVIWQVVIHPRQKRTNELTKLMFSRMLADLKELGVVAQSNPTVQLPTLNERFAEMWDVDPSKLFQTPAPAGPVPVPGAPGAAAGPAASSAISMPNPEAAMSKAVNNLTAQ